MNTDENDLVELAPTNNDYLNDLDDYFDVLPSANDQTLHVPRSLRKDFETYDDTQTFNIHTWKKRL